MIHDALPELAMIDNGHKGEAMLETESVEAKLNAMRTGQHHGLWSFGRIGAVCGLSHQTTSDLPLNLTEALIQS